MGFRVKFCPSLLSFAVSKSNLDNLSSFTIHILIFNDIFISAVAVKYQKLIKRG